MPAPISLIPSKPAPALSLPLASGGQWSLANESGDFTLLVFYRGYHCPKCKEQLLEIQDADQGLKATGTNVIAISMDEQERAEKTKSEWGLDKLPIAYGLTGAQAREWGLWLSSSKGKTSIGVEELTIFNEPGIFLVRNDGTLHAAWVQTVPMARPKIEDIISAITFFKEKNYPPRGIVEDV